MKTKTEEEFKIEATELVIKMCSHFGVTERIEMSWLYHLMLRVITQNYAEGMKAVAEEIMKR